MVPQLCGAINFVFMLIAKNTKIYLTERREGNGSLIKQEELLLNFYERITKNLSL